MRHLSFLLLLIFGFGGYTVFSQEVQVDSELLRDIMRGHQLLTQQTECLSGKIELSMGDSSTTKPEPTLSERRFLFFRDKDLLRLEYINPGKDTGVFPGHEKNDITEVLMKSKEHFFRYWAIPAIGLTTGAPPYANLRKSAGSDPALEMTLGGDFYDYMNALVAMSGSMNFNITDLLQNEIGSVESRRYKGISDALWIKGVHDVDEAGNISDWTIVLNPKQHYAMLFHEMRVENSKTAFLATSSKTVTSQVSSDGKIFPNEIVFKGLLKSQVDGQTHEVNTWFNALVSIYTTEKPDERLFTEESFKDMGRDYAVVDVLPNQTMSPSGYAVDAAPLASRVPYYPVEEFSTSDWTWTRIFFLSSGIVLIVVACLRMYFRWKHFKNQ